MQMPDDRDGWRDSRRRLVDRRQMVQVQRVEFSGADDGQGARPLPHLTLVGVVVKHGKHPVRSAGAILIRRLDRRETWGRIERVGRGECLVE